MDIRLQHPALVASGLVALLLLASGCLSSAEDAGGSGFSTEEDQLTGPKLVLVKEKKLSSLLGSGTFEASGVQVQGGSLFVVFDNMTKFAEISSDLSSGALKSAGSKSKSSNFEGITESLTEPGLFFVVEESAGGDDRGVVHTFDESGDELIEEPTDVDFADPNKGFEGIASMVDGSSEVLLGLCEGNSCKDDVSDVGHGRIKVLGHGVDSWATEASIKIPATAKFKDYSDIALLDQGDGTLKVAITSQESKRLWIGTLSSFSWSFQGEGAVFSFPSSGYCNVEGVSFLSDTRIAVVSDKTKDSGSCELKEQMVHIFDIP